MAFRHIKNYIVKHSRFEGSGQIQVNCNLADGSPMVTES